MSIAAPSRPRISSAAKRPRARAEEHGPHSPAFPGGSAQQPGAEGLSVPTLVRRGPLRVPARMGNAASAMANSKEHKDSAAGRSSGQQAKPTMRLRPPERRKATASALPPLPAPWPTATSPASVPDPAALPKPGTAPRGGSSGTPADAEHTPQSTAPHRSQWDRCRMSTPYPKSVVWHDSTASLDAPLPLDAPKLESIVEILGAACLDVLLGHRAPSSLRPWLTEDILLALKRRASLALRIKGRAPVSQKGSVRKIFTTKVRERAWEVTLVTHDGEKYRAMAMRVEFWNGRWRLMALDIG